MPNLQSLQTHFYYKNTLHFISWMPTVSCDLADFVYLLIVEHWDLCQCSTISSTQNQRVGNNPKQDNTIINYCSTQYFSLSTFSFSSLTCWLKLKLHLHFVFLLSLATVVPKAMRAAKKAAAPKKAMEAMKAKMKCRHWISAAVKLSCNIASICGQKVQYTILEPTVVIANGNQSTNRWKMKPVLFMSLYKCIPRQYYYLD